MSRISAEGKIREEAERLSKPDEEERTGW